MHGSVGSICAEIYKKRFFAFLYFTNKALGIIKINITTETFDWNCFTIMKVGAIEICIVPVVRCLAYSAATMSQDFLEPSIFRPVRIVITKVPLPKHARMITTIPKDLSNRYLVMTKHGTTHDSVPNSCSISPSACNKSSSSWRTGWCNMIICESNRFAVELI